MRFVAGSYGQREIAQETNTLAIKFFHDHKYVLVIELYTRSIALDGSNAAYWANLVFACFKIEEYAKAIQDATKAIQVESNYTTRVTTDVDGRISPSEDFRRRWIAACDEILSEVAMKLRDCERETIIHKLDGAVILPNLTTDATKKLMKLRLQGAVSMLESRRA